MPMTTKELIESLQKLGITIPEDGPKLIEPVGQPTAPKQSPEMPDMLDVLERMTTKVQDEIQRLLMASYRAAQVAQGNKLTLDMILDIIVDKGIASEQEVRQKLEERVIEPLKQQQEAFKQQLKAEREKRRDGQK